MNHEYTKQMTPLKKNKCNFNNMYEFFRFNPFSVITKKQSSSLTDHFGVI